MKSANKEVIRLLDAAGLPWGDVQEGRLVRYLDEIREWNAYASLVSCGDLEKLEMHASDSLSLGAVIARLGGGTVLDIGSGSGFPAIPLAILFSGSGEIASSHPGGAPRNDKGGMDNWGGGGENEIASPDPGGAPHTGKAVGGNEEKEENGTKRSFADKCVPQCNLGTREGSSPVRFVLVERSEKKAGFLRQVTGLLGLDRVEVVWGEFPQVVKDRKMDIVTARAVERPEKVIKGIVPFVKGGAKYLCQSGDPSGWLRGMFHVEPIVDAWTKAGFRRGTLYLVQKIAAE